MTMPAKVPVRSRRLGLKSKLILEMLLVGLVPLVAGLSLAFLQGSREIHEVSGESFKALAVETSRKLDLLVANEVARTSRIATDPEVVAALEAQRDAILEESEPIRSARLTREAAAWEARDRSLPSAAAKHPLARLLHEYYAGSRNEPDQLLPPVVRAATRELYLTDIMGRLVASLTETAPFSSEQAVWWRGAFHRGVGRVYIEDVHFDEQLKTHVISISLPVMDSLRYEAVGVLHRVIDAKEFFGPSTFPIRFGKTGHVMLIDSHGMVLSCPILPTGVRLSDPNLIPLVTPMEDGWVQASSDGHGGTGSAIIGFSPLPETSRITNGSLDAGGWHTFVWQSSEELFAPIRHLSTWMSIFGLLAIALLGALGAFSANRIVTPIRQLQAAARAIGRGELREPIVINTGDELEDLADEITRMNAQLEQSFAGLESQVELKSEEVQILQRSTDQILDAVPAPIFLLDQEAHVHYMNRASREAFALPSTADPPPQLFELLQLPMSARERLSRELARVGNGAALLTTSHAPGGRVATARDPLAQSSRQEDESARRELPIAGMVYRYEWFPLAARASEQARVGMVLRNATDESRLQDQLIEAEKSGSLGVLTAGIGHELNNPLFGILGLGEAIQHEHNPDQIKDFAKHIVQHGKRMAAIIRDFTGITRGDRTERKTAVDLATQLDQALSIVQHSSPDWHIDVQRAYSPVPQIQAVPQEIQQAMMNVLHNAVQAMNGHGTLILAITSTPPLIQLSIRDSGPGIAPHQLGKVFDPFFTTKEQGQGSGLGLTIARRLLVKSGGHLRLESVLGQGTTCFMTFPMPTEGSRQEAGS